MLQVAQVAVCSQVNTKHTNTVWAERTVLRSTLLVAHSRLLLRSCYIRRVTALFSVTNDVAE